MIKTIILIFAVGLMGEIPPAARSVIVDQRVVRAEYKQTRDLFERECTDVLDIPLENGYRHLVCIQTYISELHRKR